MSLSTTYLLTLILLIITQTSNSRPLKPVFTAACSHGNCYFSNLNLSSKRSSTFYDVESDIPAEDVTFVSLGGGQDGSKMYTLTKKICEKFPNVEEMWASNLGLQKIDKNAFEACKKLEILDLSGNSLRELNSIENLGNLKELDLSNNQLANMDEKKIVKNLKNLKSLQLCPNDKMQTDRLLEIATHFNANRIEFYELDYC